MKAVVGILTALLLAGSTSQVIAQPVAMLDGDLVTAIDSLGEFDFDVRVQASRFVRRAPVEQARPALVAAVDAHEDEYVRFRALVLLLGFGGDEAGEAARLALEDKNDRLRAVAYGYFGHYPDPTMAGLLLAALELETSEFVRPSLIRALAAHDADPIVRERLVADIDRGVDFFRGAVIEALGDRAATYALDPLIRIASEPGPLQDDAVLALARIGDKRALPTVALLQGRDVELEPMVSAVAVSLGVDRDEHARFVTQSLLFAAASGDQPDIVRSASAGLGALASIGDTDALAVLFEVGVGAPNAAREPIALEIGSLAMRHPVMVIGHLATCSDLDAAVLLLRDAFDMLDEDLEEEHFFMTVRTAFWAATEGSPDRAATDALIAILEF